MKAFFMVNILPDLIKRYIIRLEKSLLGLRI